MLTSWFSVWPWWGEVYIWPPPQYIKVTFFLSQRGKFLNNKKVIFSFCDICVLIRPVVFDAIMRVRTSTGVRPTDFFGAFYMVRRRTIHCFLASMSFFTGQHDRHGIGFIEQRHGAGLWDQARWQADRRRRSLYTGVIQSCRPLSQIFFLIWLDSGSIALHILFWAEETKNMQHVTERWIFFFFSSKYAVQRVQYLGRLTFVHL